jgi:MHS family citrate/tricarballylate:H+ symporter-like MFS transporter
VSVYLSEIATPGNKGFYTSWQSASQQVAIVMAALIGYALNATLAMRRSPNGAGAFPSLLAA